jgi:TPR repeat protein
MPSEDLVSDKELFDEGMRYFSGNNCEKSYSKALFFITKSADNGFADAQNFLGILYSLGIGVAQSDTKAVKWIRKAADQGKEEAQYNLHDV